MSSIYVMLPAYNEAKNLVALLDKWESEKPKLKKLGYDLKITVVNDASTDDTEKVVKTYQRQHKNVALVTHEKNKGLSGGLNTGISEFLEQAKDDDLLVFMDADNTHDPKYIENMVKKLDKADCVIASRYQKGADIKGLAKNREMMSIFARLYYSILLHIPGVKDYTCGYRVYKYNIIKKLREKYGSEPIKEKSFACMMELLYKVYEVGAKFDEIGFVLRYDNKKGESKMKVANTAKKSIFTAIKLKKVDILIKILLIMAAGFFSTSTNFSPLNNQLLYSDASVYAYTGMAMKEGDALYTQAWDNKGPVLYTIYALGQIVAGDFGIFLLEFLALYIALLYSYKSIRMLAKNNRLVGFFGTLFAFSFIRIVSPFGSLCEDFALPLMMLEVYFAIKYFKNGLVLKKSEMILFGITAGWIAMIRLNLLSVLAGFAITVLCVSIKYKKPKEIIRWLIYGTLGLLISVIPYVIYLSLTGSLEECLDVAYFGTLGSFANGGGKINRMEVTLQLLNAMNITNIVYIMFAAAILSIIAAIRNKKTISFCLALFLIFSTIINIYAISLSGYPQQYYCVSFVPIAVLAVGMICGHFIQQARAIDLALAGMMIFLMLPGYFSSATNIINNYKPTGNSSYYPLIEYIKNNTTDEDRVQTIGGLSNRLNYGSKRLSPTKFSYVPLLSGMTKEYKTKLLNEEFIPEITTSDAKMIIMGNSSKEVFYELLEDDVAWDEFLKSNYILQEEVTPEYTVYIRK